MIGLKARGGSAIRFAVRPTQGIPRKAGVVVRTSTTRVRRAFLSILAICLLASCVQSRVSLAGPVMLDIDPVMQKTPSWCWLATGEMVFEYYDIPPNDPSDFQCGEAKGEGAVFTGRPGPIAFTGPCWTNCYVCAQRGAGTLRGLYNLIIQYPQIVAVTAGNQRRLTARVSASPLSLSQVQREIDGKRPIIAGISPGIAGYLPPGVSEHAVLIIGYELNSNSVIINDPFPYRDAGMTPMYIRVGGVKLQEGQYQVSYSALVGPIRWSNAVYGIQ